MSLETAIRGMGFRKEGDREGKPRVSRLETGVWGGRGEKARMITNSNSEANQKGQGQANDHVRNPSHRHTYDG